MGSFESEQPITGHLRNLFFFACTNRSLSLLTWDEGRLKNPDHIQKEESFVTCVYYNITTKIQCRGNVSARRAGAGVRAVVSKQIRRIITNGKH